MKEKRRDPRPHQTGGGAPWIKLEQRRSSRREPACERQIARSSLFDPVDAARKLETAFARMHERRQNGLPPDHIYL